MNDEEVTRLIIKEFGRHHDRKQIIQKVCEQTTLNWKDAERLIEEVATQNQRKIAARQSPLLIGLSLVILVLGLGLVLFNVQFILAFFQKDTVGQLLSLHSGYYRLGELVSGFVMTIAGFYGLWRILGSLFPD